MRRRNTAVTAAVAGAAAGVVGLATLALPALAGPDPRLPEVSPRQLVESVMTASPPAMSGTVRVDNSLGLPALPGMGEASQVLTDSRSEFRVWADGQGRHRLALPSPGGEMTVVNDGTTVWKWDSGERTVTRSAPGGAEGAPGHGAREPGQVRSDPADASRRVLDALRPTSGITVDGTARVAGRDAYELVLTPKPTERTVLREVRIAVDAEKRIPLRLVVNTNGSGDPALRVGFSELEFAPQDPGLFQFTPPAGASVEQAAPHEQRGDRPHDRAADDARQVVGDGWDAVLVGRLPQEALRGGQEGGGQDEARAPRSLLERVGEPVRGPWGTGRLVTTDVGSVLLTSDGRFAVGAVPRQVLTEAIGAVR